MNLEGILFHVGINFVISPPPEINQKRSIAFQNALVEGSIDFSDVTFRENEIVVQRELLPLEIKVAAISGAPVGQLLILASMPNRELEIFARESESVVTGFSQTWQEQRQILACDCTIRYLYETSSEHAFSELWESRLHQPPQSLEVFGRPILGGGLRLVMPPISDEGDATQVEVKIESYLQDSKKILVEVGFKWPHPQPPSHPLDPGKRLQIVSDYLEHHVIRFLGEGNHE